MGSLNSLSVQAGLSKSGDGFWVGAMAVEVVSPVELRREIEGVLSSASTLYTT